MSDLVARVAARVLDKLEAQLVNEVLDKLEPQLVNEHQFVTAEHDGYVVPEGTFLGKRLTGPARRKDLSPQERRLHDNATLRRRTRRMKARQERIAEREQRESRVSDKDLRRALPVTALLSMIIDEMATTRARRLGRLIADGSIIEDACFDTFALVNRTIAAETLRENPRSLNELEVAARWLSERPERLPDVRSYDDAPAHAKWLMAVIDYQTRKAMRKWSNERPSISLEALALVEADQHNALTEPDPHGRSPEVLGSIMVCPGENDPAMRSVAVDAAVTQHRLDPLYELVLTDGSTRTDGLLCWTALSATIYQAMGLSTAAAPNWDKLTPEQRGYRARKAARYKLRWLPDLMEQWEREHA